MGMAWGTELLEFVDGLHRPLAMTRIELVIKDSQMYRPLVPSALIILGINKGKVQESLMVLVLAAMEPVVLGRTAMEPVVLVLAVAGGGASGGYDGGPGGNGAGGFPGGMGGGPPGYPGGGGFPGGARSHCKESLQGVMARRHCKESLQGVIARSHCKE